MSAGSPTDRDIEALFTADRVARAAILWLRRQAVLGEAATAGRQRRDMAAGLVQRLADHLSLARPEALVAGYALALLDAQADMAMDVPLRMTAAATDSGAYAAGVAAADELLRVLAEGPARSPGTGLP